jgi:hypothetical protein
MTSPDRRAFMAATAASIATPAGLGANECPNAGMPWITMSLEARNLAYNNVEHVGPDNSRKKTEDWAAASKTLREQCPEHLDLAYGSGERNKWDLYPASVQTVFYVTGGGQPAIAAFSSAPQAFPSKLARQYTATVTRSFTCRRKVLRICSGASPSWRALIGNGDTGTCAFTRVCIY